MKIRKGFVTNSSSSSFIVAFPKEVKSEQDVLDMLFMGDPEYVLGVDYTDYMVKGSQAARTIFGDIQNQSPNNLTDIADVMEGYCEIYPSNKRFKMTDGNIDWALYEAVNEEISINKLDTFIKKNPNSFIYTLNYGDDDGSYFSILEHGDTFKNVPHICISNH